MRLPDFIIIGAAKSGTTTLYEYMQQHVNIYMCTPKEPNYFAMDAVFNRGVEWYGALFRDATPEQLCGEASTNYTNWPCFEKSAARMADLLPDARLIYIMRHPVDRAYSQYVQLIKNARGRNPDLKVEETFEEHIQRDSSVLDGSDYMMQIEQYLKHYPRESMLFLLLDDLKTGPDKVISNVFRFLGLSDSPEMYHSDKIIANQARPDIDWLVRSQMTKTLRSLPGAEYMASFMPQGMRDGIYSILRRLPYRNRIEREYVPQPMQSSTRQQLLERYRDSNEKLSEFLQRDLSHWNS